MKYVWEMFKKVQEKKLLETEPVYYIEYKGYIHLADLYMFRAMMKENNLPEAEEFSLLTDDQLVEFILNCYYLLYDDITALHKSRFYPKLG
jgi:hypothetical protein